MPRTSKNKVDDSTKTTKKNKEKSKNIEYKVKDGFDRVSIKLDNLLKLDDTSKHELIEDTLKNIYETKDIFLDKEIIKIISMLSSKTDEDVLVLPDELKVEKKDKEVVFYIKKKKIGVLWLVLFLSVLIIATILATYGAIRMRHRSDLNKDIDKDGIADINIDINGDFVADLNIDIDKDDKPDLNIDYKGNRKSMFNIDINNDGIVDFNPVYNVNGDPKACTVNCDIDGDGWPDMNFDIDGDGNPDLDIDTDKDGIPDLNLDIDGDTYCDAMCDDDGDGVCDKHCVKIDDNERKTGPSTKTGIPDYEPNGYLQINYYNGDTLNIINLFPDGQNEKENHNGTINIPSKTLKVENISNYAVMYTLELVVNSNTFTSSNFKYKIEAMNGGGSFDWQTVPFKSTTIFEKVFIPARTTQTYKVSFKLEETYANQNYDQGKEFIGYFALKSL